MPIQIILCMLKELARPIISIHTFYCNHWLWSRTVKALIRIRGCEGWSVPSESGPSLSTYIRRHVFAWRGLVDGVSLFLVLNRAPNIVNGTRTNRLEKNPLFCEMSQPTTKPIIRLVRPTKTQIRLRIRAVWSESSMIACAFYNLWAIQRGVNKNPCLTGKMYRLIWVFAGLTGLIVGFFCFLVFFLHGLLMPLLASGCVHVSSIGIRI